jgi:hypothetical protein
VSVQGGGILPFQMLDTNGLFLRSFRMPLYRLQYRHDKANTVGYYGKHGVRTEIFDNFRY